MSLSDTIKLTLTSQRKLLAIENDNFRIRLNGKHNTDYASILKLLGVTLVFQDEDKSIAAACETGTLNAQGEA